jgi:hypothetical protein
MPYLVGDPDRLLGIIGLVLVLLLDGIGDAEPGRGICTINRSIK